jgi:hypothetical protein
MIGNEKELKNEVTSLTNNKEPKMVPHHTWVSLIFYIFLPYSNFLHI